MPQYPSSQIWTLRNHSKFVQGDLTYPTTSEASSIFRLREASMARSLGIFPNDDVVTTSGKDYADSYIATTGGSITVHGSTSGSLNTAVDALSDGDVLLLSAGSYTLTAVTTETYSSDPMRTVNALIAGDTDDADDVVIEVTHTSARGHHVFADEDTASLAPSTYKQYAFIRFKRLDTSGTSYVNALSGGVASYKAHGRMVNCIFDGNAGDVSWIYDNSQGTAHDVAHIRTTFINYNNWDASYTGASGAIVVNNCLFDDTTDETKTAGAGSHTIATLTDCVKSATIQLSDGQYDTNTYSTAGHLYIPNTTAVF